jgi:carbamoyltransferase
MLLVAPVKESRRKPFEREGTDLTAIVRRSRSDIPAVTHVDYSARVQTVVRSDHPAYYDVIKAFAARTGCGVVVNTSFNVRGEPIVCTPDDAYRCFMRTEMDVLVLGDVLLRKEDQPPWPEAKGHIEEDDDLHARDPVEEGLTAALDEAFYCDFLPAVSGLGKDGVRVPLAPRRRPTAWVDVEGAPAGKDVFAIPPALDVKAPDPAKMAEAITAFWAPGPASEAMRRVLVKLLEIGRRFSGAEERAQERAEERVSHTMYVMY